MSFGEKNAWPPKKPVLQLLNGLWRKKPKSVFFFVFSSILQILPIFSNLLDNLMGNDFSEKRILVRVGFHAKFPST